MSDESDKVVIGKILVRLDHQDLSLQRIDDKLDALRSPRLWPIVIGLIAVTSLLGTIGQAYVTMKLEPIRNDLVRDGKDIERVKDDVRIIYSRIDSKADKSYVDDKIAYAYDRLKTEMKLKAQNP